MSHFVVDEDLDRGFLDAMKRKDADALISIPAYNFLRHLRVEELDSGRGRHERGRARDDGHRLSAALSLFGWDRQRNGLRVLAVTPAAAQSPRHRRS
jgi:hypothetical protein